MYTYGSLPAGRLCSSRELLDGCASLTGCNHDNDLIWSSTAREPDRRLPPPPPARAPPPPPRALSEPSWRAGPGVDVVSNVSGRRRSPPPPPPPAPPLAPRFFDMVSRSWVSADWVSPRCDDDPAYFDLYACGEWRGHRCRLGAAQPRCARVAAAQPQFSDRTGDGGTLERLTDQRRTRLDWLRESTRVTGLSGGDRQRSDERCEMHRDRHRDSPRSHPGCASRVGGYGLHSTARVARLVRACPVSCADGAVAARCAKPPPPPSAGAVAAAAASPPAECDSSLCESSGSDCCAPLEAREAARCAGGFVPVRLVGAATTCYGWRGGKYTCCPPSIASGILDAGAALIAPAITAPTAGAASFAAATVAVRAPPPPPPHPPLPLPYMPPPPLTGLRYTAECRPCYCGQCSEPCYYDPACADGTGAAGCQAGGKPSCRFCGFGAFASIPCPPS